MVTVRVRATRDGGGLPGEYRKAFHVLTDPDLLAGFHLMGGSGESSPARGSDGDGARSHRHRRRPARLSRRRLSFRFPRGGDAIPHSKAIARGDRLARPTRAHARVDHCDRGGRRSRRRRHFRDRGRRSRPTPLRIFRRRHAARGLPGRGRRRRLRDGHAEPRHRRRLLFVTGARRSRRRRRARNRHRRHGRARLRLARRRRHAGRIPGHAARRRRGSRRVHRRVAGARRPEGDGTLEIVVGTTEDYTDTGRLYVVEADGTIADGFPKTSARRGASVHRQRPAPSPALADVDGDGTRSRCSRPGCSRKSSAPTARTTL